MDWDSFGIGVAVGVVLMGAAIWGMIALFGT